MSKKLETMAWDSALPTAEKVVLALMCDFANDEGSSCYPSRETLARKYGSSKRTIQRIIAKLEERGLLMPIKNQKGGTSKDNKGYTVHYQINVEALKHDILSPLVEGGKGDTGDAPRVTNTTTKGDASVIQSVSDPLYLTLSGGGTESIAASAEEIDRADSPPPAFFEKDEAEVRDAVSENTNPACTAPQPPYACEATKIVQAHHAIEREIFGIHPDKQPLLEGDIAVAESWLKLGITHAFCERIFTARMRDRKMRGRGVVGHFRYWTQVIPDQWSKEKSSNSVKPVKEETSSITTPRKEFDPQNAVIHCTAPELQNYLRHDLQILPEQWEKQCRFNLVKLREHPAWVAVLERMEKRMGKPWCDNWLRPCSPVVMTHDRVILWCPSRLIQAEIASQRQWDVHASFQHQIGDHVKLILTT
jgi:hypothetical protein